MLFVPRLAHLLLLPVVHFLGKLLFIGLPLRFLLRLTDEFRLSLQAYRVM
jgi:hypothetical protein